MAFFGAVLPAMVRDAKIQTWFGPATATFPVQFAGDPYDPSENDVQVSFTDRSGHEQTRLAYFNAEIGSWQAILVAHQSGTFNAKLIRNGKVVPGKPREGTIKLMTALPHGFIRPSSRFVNRFEWDDGTPCTPIGFDLGWHNGGLPPLPDQIAKMGASGVNWTRIWACSWDGKNPWWPSDHSKLEGRALWPAALQQWERIEESCEAAHVGMQMVLFHHGEFSSQVDPNWPDNPYNVKNGGFLKAPGDFFTDAEAKTRAKIWLRYAVARYGASPAIFGWELFNEVQWVDPIHINHRWDEVEAWHHEMADYVRSIDPYHHPVTSSSELRPNFDSALDYVQPHTYPNNIFAAVVGTVMPPGKPGFYGEFGPGNPARVDPAKAIRDGLLGGLIANHAGAGMYWYWDVVEPKNLYPVFSVCRKLADLSGWSQHPMAQLTTLKCETPQRSTFRFEPGAGWAPTTQFEFNLPEGASARALGNVSSYIQGDSNRAMMPKPLVLRFNLDAPSKVGFEVGSVSNGGGTLAVEVDGRSVIHQAYQHSDLPAPLSVDLNAGSHEVTIHNDGADWVTLKSLAIEHLAPQVSVAALSDSRWVLARLVRNDKSTGLIKVRLSGVPLPAGRIKVTALDMESGAVTHSSGSLTAGQFEFEDSAADQMVVLEKG